jgi:hypothetical protein
MGYSKLTGVWKSVVNNLVVLGPAIVAGLLEFMAALPEGIAVKYALPLGLLTYFLKNWYKNKDI